jgi:hypothetical protein
MILFLRLHSKLRKIARDLTIFEDEIQWSKEGRSPYTTVY